MTHFNDKINTLRAIYSVPLVGQVLNIATTAVVIYYTGGCVQCGIAVSSALSSLQAGVTSGKFSEAFKAGAIAGAEAEAFYGIGTATGFHGATWGYATDNAGMYALNVAGHAAVGCISAAAAGGDCGPQALAAGISAAAAPVLNSEFPDPNHNLGDLIGGTVASASVGGLSAVAGGGKFENGAITGAFGYLFNDALHPNNKMTSGWGQNGFDPDQWQLVGTTRGDPLVFTAGDQIGVLASSSAGPLPTNQFWFSVNAQALDQNGNPIPSMPAEYDTPSAYSSGPTGNGSANPFTFRAQPPGSAPTSGYRWTVGIPPQEDAHGNYDFNTLRVYVPKPLTQ